MSDDGDEQGGLGDLEDLFIECRARRHRWDEIPYDGETRRDTGGNPVVTVITSRCERCHTKKYEFWNDLTGHILWPADYVYPEKYLLKGGGVKPWDVRAEFLYRRRERAKPTYVCNVCSKGYKRQSDLTKHEKTHG